MVYVRPIVFALVLMGGCSPTPPASTAASPREVSQPSPARSAAPPSAAANPASDASALTRPGGAVRDAAGHFAGAEGSFVLLDLDRDQVVRHNPALSARRSPPASTFKIPNALIALDTGVASGSDFSLPFDAVRNPPEAWWPREWARDQTLQTALRYSAVWYFQELARRIGESRMRRYVTAFDYGNADIGDRIDEFWLAGPLGISPDEQVAFLRRLYRDELPVQPRTADLVRQMLVLERGSAHELSGKTGTLSPRGDEPRLGWFVGHVQGQAGRYVFALLVVTTPEDFQRRWSTQDRVRTARRILRDWGACTSCDAEYQPG